VWSRNRILAVRALPEIIVYQFLGASHTAHRFLPADRVERDAPAVRYAPLCTFRAYRGNILAPGPARWVPCRPSLPQRRDDALHGLPDEDEEVSFALDALVEEARFEPSVPRKWDPRMPLDFAGPTPTRRRLRRT
jgi:hypothetical protein